MKSFIENIEHISIFSLNFFAIFFEKTFFSLENKWKSHFEWINNTAWDDSSRCIFLFFFNAILNSIEMNDFNMQEMQPLACKMAKMVKTREAKTKNKRWEERTISVLINNQMIIHNNHLEIITIHDVMPLWESFCLNLICRLLVCVAVVWTGEIVGFWLRHDFEKEIR